MTKAEDCVEEDVRVITRTGTDHRTEVSKSIRQKLRMRTRMFSLLLRLIVFLSCRFPANHDPAKFVCLTSDTKSMPIIMESSPWRSDSNTESIGAARLRLQYFVLSSRWQSWTMGSQDVAELTEDLVWYRFSSAILNSSLLDFARG